MRTPEEIKAELDRIDAIHNNTKQGLLKELAQAKLGVEVGDTITSGHQSIVISQINARYIKGTLTDTNYEIRIESLEKWKKV